MQRFTLSTDTSCDVFKSELDKNDIRYVPLTFTFGNDTFEDNFDNPAQYKDFYNRIRAKEQPTTSQISAYIHEEYFEKQVMSGAKEIIHLTLSSGLSGTYESAVNAAESVMEKNAGVKIFVIDTLAATQGHRLVLDEAAAMRDMGIAAKDAVKQLEETVKKLHHWILIDDLFHLKRGGRVSGAAAYLGSMLKLKPVAVINREGKIAVYHKAKGTKGGLKYFLEKFRELSEDPQNQTVYLACADCFDLADELENMLKSEFNCTVKKGWIGPVIGSHTGAGTLGFVFKAKERVDKKA